MRLPRHCYQMQKTIETHLTHLSPPQLTSLVLWVCGAILAGNVLSPRAQLEQPAPVSPGVALRRQRPDKACRPKSNPRQLNRTELSGRI